jgi:hypothetical protein
MDSKIIEVTPAQARTLNILHSTFLIFRDVAIKTEHIYKRGKPTAVKAKITVDEIDGPRYFEYQISTSGAIIKAEETTEIGVWIADIK